MARPATLAAALTQLEHLSARLSLASTLFHQHTGKHLAPLLDASLPATAYLSTPALTPTVPPSPAPAPAAAPPTSSTEADAPQATEAGNAGGNEAFDISPLVLKALAIRKAVHVGEVEDGEVAVAELVAGLPVSEEQRKQLRTWAGL